MTEPQPEMAPPPTEETPMDMGNEVPPMENEIGEEPMNDTPMDGEGDDKKKEIQKLAGELSELLHTYNEENGDDEELNKYVKGMIDAQTDGDSADDEDMSEEPDMGDGEEIEDEPMENEMGEEPMNNTPEPKMEGRRITKKQIKEEFAQMNDKKKDEEERMNTKLNKNGVNKNNPFLPPKFN